MSDVPDSQYLRDEINRLKEDCAMTTWTKVEKRLPKVGVPVLVVESDSRAVTIAELAEGGETWLFPSGAFWSLDTVTHWMPLPKGPK